jgi:hypothetical protein
LLVLAAIVFAGLPPFSNTLGSEQSTIMGLVRTPFPLAATSPESRVFSKTLAADDYTCICQAKPDTGKNEPTKNAKQYSENKPEIATREIPPSRPTFLRLILSDSVFLCEIIGQKQEAIERGQKTSNDRNSAVDASSDNSYSEPMMIM